MSASDRRQMAGRAVVAKVFAEQAASLGKAVRTFVEPELEPGEHITAQLGDGTRIGKVRVNEQSVKAVVTDERALLGWIREHRPDELVEQIRPSYLKYLLDQAKDHGHAFDPATGEVIPGIEVGEGIAAYVVTPSAEGRALVLRKLGELVAGGLLELPSGNGSEAS